jgi:hypothetical protein
MALEECRSYHCILYVNRFAPHKYGDDWPEWTVQADSRAPGLFVGTRKITTETGQADQGIRWHIEQAIFVRKFFGPLFHCRFSSVEGIREEFESR